MARAAISQAEKKQGARTSDVVFVVAFATILCASLIAKALGVATTDLVEKRALTPAPPMPSSLKACTAFPSAFDRYAQDNFGLRADLIALNSYFHFRLGVSSSPRILVGKDGWLFYVGDPEFKFIRGRNLLSGGEISAWLNRMEERRNWLAERGIRFIVLPAPIKETIYPEYLPYWLRREVRPTLVDQLVHAASARPAITVLDVRSRLLKKKRQMLVYPAFDTHWNAEGAFVAYRALVEKLAESMPGIVPLGRESVALTAAPPQRIPRDLTIMLGIQRFADYRTIEYVPRSAGRTTVQYLTPKTDPNSPQLMASGIANAPRIMMIRDSFSFAMLPYLQDTFGSLLLTHVQDGTFPRAYIEQYHPDVVILEVQEAGLGVM